MRALLASLVLMALLAACEKKKEETVRTVTVERGNLKVSVATTGTVKPQNRIELKPPVAGRVEGILLQEGEPVRKGQVLAWLSSSDRAALLDAARARGEDTLKHWEAFYRPTPLISPIDGTVISRPVEPGQTVTLGDAVLVLSDRLIVQGQVDETDIGRIRLGQNVSIQLDAYSAKTSPGRVDHIAFEAKTVNNVTMYMVDVLPEPEPDFFRSGMTASLTYIVAETNDVLLVPNEALIAEKGKSSVRLATTDKGNASDPVRVETGVSDGKRTEIRSGLKEGDVLSLSGGAANGAKGKTQASNPFMPFSRPRGR